MSVVRSSTYDAAEAPTSTRHVRQLVPGSVRQLQAPSETALPMARSLLRPPLQRRSCPRLSEDHSGFLIWARHSPSRQGPQYSCRVPLSSDTTNKHRSSAPKSRLLPRGFVTWPRVTKLPCGPITTVIHRFCNSPTATDGLVTSATSKLTFTDPPSLFSYSTVFWPAWSI